MRGSMQSVLRYVFLHSWCWVFLSITCIPDMVLAQIPPPHMESSTYLPDNEVVWIGAAGDYIVVVRNDGKVHVSDLSTSSSALRTVCDFRLDLPIANGELPRFACSTAPQRLAIFRDNRATVYDLYSGAKVGSAPIVGDFLGITNDGRDLLCYTGAAVEVYGISERQPDADLPVRLCEGPRLGVVYVDWSDLSYVLRDLRGMRLYDGTNSLRWVYASDLPFVLAEQQPRSGTVVIRFPNRGTEGSKVVGVSTNTGKEVWTLSVPSTHSLCGVSPNGGQIASWEKGTLYKWTPDAGRITSQYDFGCNPDVVWLVSRNATILVPGLRLLEQTPYREVLFRPAMEAVLLHDLPAGGSQRASSLPLWQP